MTLSFRSLRRASVVTLAALTFVACRDAIAPLDVTPEDLEWVGHGMAFEIENDVATLTAAGAMNTDYWPNFSMQGRRPANGGGVAFNLQHAAGLPSFQAVDPECGVFSQNPPADSDADGVPDDLTITFGAPACHFPNETGSRELTGVIRMSDPLPGTPAPAYNMAFDDFGIIVADPELNGFNRRDGMTAVSVSASGLSQTQSWLEITRDEGYPAFDLRKDVSATFAAAQGSAIIAGEPLPDGVYALNGSIEYRVDGRPARFDVTTVEALQYSTECVAAMAAGLAWAPFTAGTVRVAVRGIADMRFAEITYTDCQVRIVLSSG
jgi:hypothetical protein